jgi:hypothetical protein
MNKGVLLKIILPFLIITVVSQVTNFLKDVFYYKKGKKFPI